MQFPYHDNHPQIADTAFVAPNATIIGRVQLAARASVWFNAVIRADINRITVGADTNIQDSCVLHVTNVHPVTLGARITVGHGAILHGCTVEDDCLISMGAVLLDGVTVGHGSLIAAGAVVAPNSNIPPNSLVMGVPGRVVRTLSAADQTKITEGWQHYVEYAEDYKRMLNQTSAEPSL